MLAYIWLLLFVGFTFCVSNFRMRFHVPMLHKSCYLVRYLALSTASVADSSFQAVAEPNSNLA